MERRPSDEHVEQLLTRSLARGAAPGGVCPAADVLAAFVDGGLDPGERVQLTQHAASCPRCAQILAIVLEPAAAPAALVPPVSRRPWLERWRWMVPIATAATVASIWILTRDAIGPIVPPSPASQRAPAEPATVEPPSPPQQAMGGRAVVVPPSESARARSAPDTSTAPVDRFEARREAAESTTVTSDQAPAPEAPPVPVAAPSPPPPLALPLAPPAPTIAAPQDAPSARPPAQAQGRAGGAGGDRGVAGGVVGGIADKAITVTGASPNVDVQNARQATSPPVIWRSSGAVIERSTDEGRTWTTAYDTGRTVLARSTPAPEVGWFVGVRGLVVRRFGAEWSVITAPATVDVVAVQATSERAATITLADGRVFATTDAGMTWTPR